MSIKSQLNSFLKFCEGGILSGSFLKASNLNIDILKVASGKIAGVGGTGLVVLFADIFVELQEPQLKELFKGVWNRILPISKSIHDKLPTIYLFRDK